MLVNRARSRAIMPPVGADARVGPPFPHIFHWS